MQNLIVASSRGIHLGKHLKSENTCIKFESGGKIRNLTTAAVNHIKTQQVDFVYFVAGLPDITTKLTKDFYLNGEKCRYEEIIFTEDPTATIHRVQNIIRDAETKIKAVNAIPVFTTITPCNINRYNHHRLEKHFTSHLEYFQDYSHQQERLHTAIATINQIIHLVNSQNEVVTPKLAQLVTYKRRGHWRYRYGRLYDGTHATPKLNKKWAKILDKIIAKNISKAQTSIENTTLPDTPEVLAYFDSSEIDTDSESDCSEN